MKVQQKFLLGLLLASTQLAASANAATSSDDCLDLKIECNLAQAGAVVICGIAGIGSDECSAAMLGANFVCAEYIMCLKGVESLKQVGSELMFWDAVDRAAQE